MASTAHKNTSIMTTSTATDAVMSRSRMGTMSTTCTKVTFIDGTTSTDAVLGIAKVAKPRQIRAIY
jgi:hypothetical protein